MTVSLPVGDRNIPTAHSIGNRTASAAYCSRHASSLAAAASGDSRRWIAAALWPAAITLAGTKVAPGLLAATAAAGAFDDPAKAAEAAGTVGAIAPAGGAAAAGPMPAGGRSIDAPPPLIAPAKGAAALLGAAATTPD